MSPPSRAQQRKGTRGCAAPHMCGTAREPRLAATLCVRAPARTLALPLALCLHASRCVPQGVRGAGLSHPPPPPPPCGGPQGGPHTLTGGQGGNLSRPPLSCLVTYCKSRFDAVNRSQPSGFGGLTEKRSAIEALSIKQIIGVTNVQVKWVHF